MTLAEELNEALEGSVAGRLLSDMGKRMYFPRGILSQSAEADQKAKRFNATIGMAYEEGEPLILDAIRAALPSLTPYESVAYASTAGVPELRKRWKAALEDKNPSLRGKVFSLPVVVPGLTAAVSYISDLFLDPGDVAVVPDLHWPNYRLVVESRRTGVGLTYPLFAGQGFNVEGFEARLREGAKNRRKVAAILNFPNNPTGYSPTLAEAERIVETIGRVADEGSDVLVVTDDAYFGLQYEEGILRESLFGRLADFHERVLVAKADGPTKEDYVWGFRLGFVSFAGKGLDATRLDALTKKLMGVIRSSVSNSNGPGQHLLLKALGEPGYEAQKARYRELLASRYRKVRAFLDRTALPPCLQPLPFNSGYFMSLECRGISAETLRLRLLDKGIGTIALGERHLRVAFSCVEASDIDELYLAIVAEATALAGAAAP